MWGRLPSLRPAFQPALAPFTHRPLIHPIPPAPSGTCRQACHTGLAVEHAVLRATPDVRVEHAVLRATPPVLAADGFCPSLPRFGAQTLFVGQPLPVVQAF